jgi:hypothetical protein
MVYFQKIWKEVTKEMLKVFPKNLTDKQIIWKNRIFDFVFNNAGFVYRRWNKME